MDFALTLSCPLCSKPGAEPDREVQGIQYFRCRACGSLFPDPASVALEKRRNEALTRTLDDIRRDFAATTVRLHAMEQSTTWRATAPVRELGAKFPSVARVARNGLRLARWTVTGQLLTRVRRWRDDRAHRLGYMPELHQVRPEEIALPRHDRPVVSVVIPTYGKVDYVLRCLGSICRYAPATPFEVIVAEDASGDPAVAQLRGIANLRLLESESNQGFLLNANTAASQAKGEFLLFLNNDTQVLRGWLDSLVDLLRRYPDAGAAGSKLLFANRRLQEAGAIIWADGSGWNYGRSDDPALPVYNYVREVDYASGASLIVRRSLFEALGGFDEELVPAYYEDTDLAFRIRQQGLKVLYQPRSVVVHFEGISHGRDVANGIKAYQVTNARKFVERWCDVLAREHFSPGTHIMRARDHARSKRIVLVIDHYVPQPDRDAGSRTMIAFMRTLQNSGRVVKFWPANNAHSPGYTEALQDGGIEVCYGLPFVEWIRENGIDLDAVLLSRPTIADQFISLLRVHSSARIVFYGHDLHFRRLRDQAEVTGSLEMSREADRMEQCERAIWRQVDAVLYPSEEEAECVARITPGTPVQSVVPYAFDQFAAERKPVGGTQILFVGGFAHPPNEDAAAWFVTDILPQIISRCPSAHLSIVGSNPTAAVRALAAPHVSVIADVSDAALQDFYARARLAVVPLRFGAGLKLKVVEALKEGVPLVTTPVGAQGCPGLASVAAVHADAARFAAAVSTLLADDAAWSAASKRQVEYARARFSEAAMRRSLLGVAGL